MPYLAHSDCEIFANLCISFVSSSSVECETLYSGCHRDGEEEQGAGRCNYDDRNDYNDPNDMTTRLGWLKTQPDTARKP